MDRAERVRRLSGHRSTDRTNDDGMNDDKASNDSSYSGDRLQRSNAAPVVSTSSSEPPSAFSHSFHGFDIVSNRTLESRGSSIPYIDRQFCNEPIPLLWARAFLPLVLFIVIADNKESLFDHDLDPDLVIVYPRSYGGPRRVSDSTS